MDKSQKKEIPLYLRVLGYRESGNLWAAHCLETDLVGYGASFEDALDNLLELTDMQISFAFYKNQPSLLDRPAPTWVFESYNQGLRSSLEYFNIDTVSEKNQYFTSIPLSHGSLDADFAVAPM